MKKTIKKLICLVLVASVVLSFAGCAKINYVTNATIGAMKQVKSGEWKNAGAAGGAETEMEPDTAKIDEFKPGTYAGVELASVDDLVALYAEAYNNTKSHKAMYTNDEGKQVEYYDFLGTEALEVKNILIEGKENSVINNLVPSIAGSAFQPSTWGLSPCWNVSPADDKNDQYDFAQLMLTADDVLAANAVDNGDGTITIQIQPKGADMSQKGQDSQGRFFMVLGDVAGEVKKISAITWADGDADSNVKVRYQGGTGTIKIDVAKKEVVEADFEMKCKVFVNHANIAVIKDKSANLDIIYTQHFPADAEYLKNCQKNIVKN